MTNEYDLIVIGSGSGGLSVSLAGHELGLKVLLIEKNEKNIGGECLNSGCIPSKALIHVSRLVRDAAKASDFGIEITGKPDYEKVRDYIFQKQSIIRAHENADFFRNQGLAVVTGKARFVSRNQIGVDKEVFTSKKIVIATGSKPKELLIPGIESVKVYTSEQIFNLQQLPSKLLIIGGGPIGVELGQAFQRLGSSVVLVHKGDTILEKEDPSISSILLEQLKQEGIQFYLNAQVSEFNSPHSAVIAQDTSKTEIEFDAVLSAAGRTFEWGDLNLNKAGITLRENKIVLDKFLRTSNRNVLVAGDATGSHFFSHAAELQASIILNNLFSPFKKKISYCDFSWVTFTDPEVATFGYTQSELDKKNIAYEMLALDFSKDDRAVVSDYAYGKLLLLVDRRERILGGTMIAPQAGEMIQELILAKASGLRLMHLFNKIHPYPVGSRVNKFIVLNKRRKKVTPTIKRFLKFLFRFS